MRVGSTSVLQRGVLRAAVNRVNDTLEQNAQALIARVKTVSPAHHIFVSARIGNDAAPRIETSAKA